MTIEEKLIENHIVCHDTETKEYWVGVTVGWAWENKDDKRPLLEAYLDHLAEQGYTWKTITCECGCTDLRR